MDVALADVRSRLQELDVAVVHVGIFDLNGTFRERRFRLDKLAAAYGERATFVNVLPHWDMAERVFGAGPFVGEELRFDAGSIRRYPFEAGAAVLVADFAGPSAALSPRAALERQVAKARDQGFEVRAGYEFEFHVLTEDGDTLRDKGFADPRPFAVENRCWAGESAAIHAEFVAGLEAVLRAGDIDPVSLGLELGPGCFEATLQAGSPVRAADDAAFFKAFTKAYCRRRQLTASFMAQLDSTFAGLSGHLHLSLMDAGTGADLFPAAAEPEGMSETFRSFVAGIVAVAPQAMAMSHPNVNSYRRHAAGNWAPKSASWGPENYAAAVRVVTRPAGRCRLEYRLPGSDTNPYLTLAFALAAGLWGIDQGLTLPPPLAAGGPDEMPADATALPQTLGEAARAFRSSEISRELFGDAFVDHLSRAQGVEDQALRRDVGAAERARYMEVV